MNLEIFPHSLFSGRVWKGHDLVSKPPYIYIDIYEEEDEANIYRLVYRFT